MVAIEMVMLANLQSDFDQTMILGRRFLEIMDQGSYSRHGLKTVRSLTELVTKSTIDCTTVSTERLGRVMRSFLAMIAGGLCGYICASEPSTPAPRCPIDFFCRGVRSDLLCRLTAFLKRQQMKGRIDVWISASQLIDQHGLAGAVAYAKDRIADLLQSSQAGADRWHMILDAIWELSRVAPEPSEQAH